jgi:hypothetical protein
MEVITHRRGSTYEVYCQYKDVLNVSIDITNMQVKSQIRDKTNELIDECFVEYVNRNEGAFSLRVMDTSSWPITTLTQDIQYTLADGRTINTSPITIDVIPSVTQ